MCLNQPVNLVANIFAPIVCLVGLLLAIYGIKRDRIRKLWMGVAIFILGLFATITQFPQYAAGFSVLGTLVLAYFAFLSIKSGEEREKHRIEEDNRIREEEKERDFKRRCLNDIQNWTEKGINMFVSWLVPIDRSEMSQIRPHLKPLSALNKWMMDASRTLAEDDKKALLKKVDEAAENLKQYCEVLEGKLSSEGMAQRHDQCLKSFTEVLERVADVKVKLKL